MWAAHILPFEQPRRWITRGGVLARCRASACPTRWHQSSRSRQRSVLHTGEGSTNVHPGAATCMQFKTRSRSSRMNNRYRNGAAVAGDRLRAGVYGHSYMDGCGLGKLRKRMARWIEVEKEAVDVESGACARGHQVEGRTVVPRSCAEPTRRRKRRAKVQGRQGHPEMLPGLRRTFFGDALTRCRRALPRPRRASTECADRASAILYLLARSVARAVRNRRRP